MAYEIQIKRAAAKQLEKLPEDTRRRVKLAIYRLAEDPRPQGAKKLSGEEDVWRLRIGKYRVLYEIHDDRLVILVLKVMKRDDVYRK